MNRFDHPTRRRPAGHRFVVLGAATAFALPALLGAAAPPVAATSVASAEPSPTPSATASSTPTPTATPESSAIGGPRMAERGLVFGGVGKAPPPTSAGSYLIADAATGEVLAAKNPHGRFRPASTIKTLLALTMAPRLDPNSTYTADADDTAVEGTRVGMVEHQTYPLHLLWHGLFLRSGNDAANGIAKAGAGGDFAKAVRMMNLEARRLQALDTTAVNPSGLDADGQYSSAYDLSLIGRAALQRGDLREYMRKVKIVFPGDHTRTSTKKNRKSFDVYTGNRLILRGYDGAIGVKNGYTSLARNTFIAAAERDGRTIIATLMASSGSITTDSMALLDWGFANVDEVTPVGTLVEPSSPALVSDEDGFVEPAPLNLNTGLAATDAVGAVGVGAKAPPLGLPTPLLGTIAAGAAVAGVGRAFVVRRKRHRRHPQPVAPSGPPADASPPGPDAPADRPEPA